MDSPIIGLKNFNNWTKSVLIAKFGRREGSDDPKVKVLDLGCGKGGDLQKWAKAGTDEYIGLGESSQRLRVAAAEADGPFAEQISLPSRSSRRDRVTMACAGLLPNSRLTSLLVIASRCALLPPIQPPVERRPDGGSHFSAASRPSPGPPYTTPPHHRRPSIRSSPQRIPCDSSTSSRCSFASTTPSSPRPKLA